MLRIPSLVLLACWSNSLSSVPPEKTKEALSDLKLPRFRGHYLPILNAPFVDFSSPEDGWTQIIYDQHQIAAHEPETGETYLWLHLLEDRHGRSQQKLTELIDGLQLLQETGYRIVDRRPVPIGGGRTIRIVTMEGMGLGPAAVRKGIEQSYRLSQKAIRERAL